MKLLIYKNTYCHGAVPTTKAQQHLILMRVRRNLSLDTDVKSSVLNGCLTSHGLQLCLCGLKSLFDTCNHTFVSHKTLLEDEMTPRRNMSVIQLFYICLQVLSRLKVTDLPKLCVWSCLSELWRVFSSDSMSSVGGSSTLQRDRKANMSVWKWMIDVHLHLKLERRCWRYSRTPILRFHCCSLLYCCSSSLSEHVLLFWKF